MWKRYGIPTIYLLVVFLCGLATGVFAHRFYQIETVNAGAAPSRPTPEQWKKHHMQELNQRLHLTPEQSSQISTILDDTHQEIRELMDRSKPEMDRIQNSQYAKVKAVLTPAQVTEYDRLHAERERRRTSDRKNF